MKTLRLLRHAKSAWDQPGLADRDRGLNARGERDAPKMGTALSDHVPPHGLHVSPARRAQLTLDGLCVGWPALRDCTHIIDDDLYTFAADDLMYWLAARDEMLHSVFLIGHNPALTDLVNLLCGEPLLDNLPTAGYVHLELEIETWSELPCACGNLVETLFPKALRNGYPVSGSD